MTAAWSFVVRTSIAGFDPDCSHQGLQCNGHTPIVELALPAIAANLLVAERLDRRDEIGASKYVWRDPEVGVGPAPGIRI